jgi:hypothetical protein
MFNRLPLRATNVIREYSFPATRSNWINSNFDSNFDSDSEDDMDEIQLHSFPITILIIIFNIIICINMLYIMCVVIGSIVCMYNSQV